MCSCFCVTVCFGVHMYRVPAWRHRLQCSVCESSGSGACVRCEMPSCTNAFHAMCAHTAGIYMRLEPAFIAVSGSRSVPARRTVYCNLHRPVEVSGVRTELTHRLNGLVKLSKKGNNVGAAGSVMNGISTSLHIPANK